MPVRKPHEGTPVADGGSGGKPERPTAVIQWSRYRKLRRFLARLFLHLMFWDVILAAPGFRFFRRDPLRRWERLARRYRDLAVDMGGVLIKLGQFLSTRVDILPPEVTSTLSDLQDEVPAAPFQAIEEQIQDDFGAPVPTIFPWLDPEPLGAASLAQVHEARLPDGREVVVKVLRPGIESLVETDLAAVAAAAKLFKLLRRIRRRVDLDRLVAEFSRTTRAELDLGKEGRNAERFAEIFQDHPEIRVPGIYWEHSAGQTLTLENVSGLKIDDIQALESHGISPDDVARVLYRCYMKQIFEANFVHADPHPGNLFVHPGPAPLSGNEPPSCGFQIAFVDFGMMAVIPEALRAGLREYVIGLGSKDARRIVRAYEMAGILLPGADIPRLVEVHEDILQRFWGVRMGEIRDVALSHAPALLREYRDIVYEAPFQMAVDLLFVSRAVGLLAGMSTKLDPDFDPWAETAPFAEEIAKRHLKPFQEGVWEELVAQGQLIYRLPGQLERVLSAAEMGALRVEMALGPEARRSLVRLERSLSRLTWIVLAVGLFLGGLFVQQGENPLWVGRALLGAAGLSFLLGALRRGP